MKAGKFSDAQIAFVLKQAEDGTPIGKSAERQVLPHRPFTYGVNVLPG